MDGPRDYHTKPERERQIPCDINGLHYITLQCNVMDYITNGI